MIRCWRGTLGDSYLERDPSRIAERTAVFRRLGIHAPRSALEVGCSAGWNLTALDADAYIGVEPNRKARLAAIESGHVVIDGQCDDLPFDDDTFDLVLTAGLLIHIPPRRLDLSIWELLRVTRRTLLCLEYDGDECVPYRGVKRGIWKRDYGKKILDCADRPMKMDIWSGSVFAGTPFGGCTAWKLTLSSL